MVARKASPQRSEPSLERIIGAVLSAPGVEKLAKVTIDRKALKWDIEYEIEASYRLAIEFGSRKVREGREKRRERIQDTARKLVKLLRADRQDDNEVLKHYPSIAVRPEAVILRTALAARAARRRPRDPTGWPAADEYVRWLTKRSPVDWLIGERFAAVFRRHFQVEPGYTMREAELSGSHTDGPFIRFAEAVLREYGVRTREGRFYKRASIAAALTNAKKRRSRRKRAA